MATHAQQITFDSGITVTVRPPGAAKALWLAAKFVPLVAAPENMPKAASVALAHRVARQMLPYVQFDAPADADRAVYLSETVLRTIDDWGRLTQALLTNTPKRGR